MPLPNLYMRSVTCLWIYLLAIPSLLHAQNPTPDSLDVIADSRYKIKKVRDLFIGHHYRDAWQATVRVPYIDIDKEGLVPLKQGGGVQTKSLRLERENGMQYIFRSVEKDVSKKLPVFLRGTLAHDVMQDQISATHPYGALVIPVMAEAAGVSYSIPKLGVVKDSPSLGEFRETFGNMLVLFEQRPYGDVSIYPNYAYAPKVSNSPKVFEKVRGSLKHKVDRYAMARVRLFDFWLGDIDRHQDQWRWGTFKSGEGTVYKPIARDRDFAFLKADGFIPWVLSRKWAFRLAQHFDYEVKDVAGLGMQGMYIDRSFLTQVTKAEWIGIADSIRLGLTDSIIDLAFKVWPAAIYDVDGEIIKAKLRSRRDHLSEYAEEYYMVLAEKVDILGSNERELFQIERFGVDSTRVRMYHMKDNGDRGKLHFDRTFNAAETKEIRIYGFGGADKFEITGKNKKGIKLRIIGGDGVDTVEDKSKVRGMAKKTHVYDIKDSTEIAKGSEIRNRTRNDTAVNSYVRKSFKYDVWMPLINFGFNPDDGMYLGGGLLWKQHGFRKFPFASKQKLTGAYAFRTSAFVVNYEGIFTEAIRNWDLIVESQAVFPHYSSNFYGWGNESSVDKVRDKNYYGVRYNLVSVRPFLETKSKNELNYLQIGTQYQFIDVVDDVDKFITDVDTLVTSTELRSKEFMSVWTSYTYHDLDHETAPTKGWKWKSTAAWVQRLNADGGFARISSELSTYVPIEAIQTVIAFRFGGATIVNDFEFYQGSTLGGQKMTHFDSNLRGYRRDRFVGRSSAYQNTELRTSLTRLPNYILPFELGLILFVDNGRVWYDDEESGRWHTGYGGGFTLSPTRSFIISITYDGSVENDFVIMHLGYRF